MRAYVPFRRNRTLAVVLALFTGAVGGHKFYLGRPGWGIAYALFCWTYVPAFAALLEAICYVSLADWEFDNRYNEHLSPIAYPHAVPRLRVPRPAPLPPINVKALLIVLGLLAVALLFLFNLVLLLARQPMEPAPWR